MLFERVQPGEVVDHIVGGASPVDRDQHVPAVWGWDLFQGGIQDQHVVGGGERAGVAGTLHHGQMIVGVAAPRRQRMPADAVFVMPRHRRFLACGGLDDRGIYPDHRDRLPGPGPGKRPPGYLHRRQQALVPGDDRGPSGRTDPGEHAGVSTLGQTIVTDPICQFVQRAQHRGIGCRATRTEQGFLPGQRLHIQQTRRPRR